jgi:PAS domain-containing protein
MLAHPEIWFPRSVGVALQNTGMMVEEKSLKSAEQRRSLEEAIVDTVREPLIVLCDALRVVLASRSFYRTFEATPQQTEGLPLYELGNGTRWHQAAGTRSRDRSADRQTT